MWPGAEAGVGVDPELRVAEAHDVASMWPGAEAGVGLLMPEDLAAVVLASMWPGAEAGVGRKVVDASRLLVRNASMWPGAEAGVGLQSIADNTGTVAELQCGPALRPG